MPSVMIKCPKTGKAVATGVAMDKRGFESAELTGNTFGPCPACNESHTWDKKGAWLKE